MPRLKLAKCGVMDDWYIIEKAKHEWVEQIVPVPGKPNSMYLHDSSRISDADVEGAAVEMLAIAEAIEQRGSYSAKRCAVDVQGNRALFWSPRNSQREGVASLEEADELAAQIRARLAGGTGDEGVDEAISDVEKIVEEV